MACFIFRFAWLLRLLHRGGAVAACACPVALSVPPARAASLPVDPASLAGVPLEQVKSRFGNGGFTWTREHDNRYVIYTAVKTGAPSYRCEFSEIKGRRGQICEAIRVTLPQGANPLSFLSLAPSDWKKHPAYLFDSVTREGAGYKHAVSIELVGKREDGMRVRQIFSVKRETPYISYRPSGSRTLFTVTKGWEQVLVDEYAVDYLGPKYARRFTDSDTKDLLNQNYIVPLNPAGLIVWHSGDTRKSTTFDPETQAVVGVAAELIAAVRSGKWDWVASLFDDRGRADAVAACKSRRKAFALAHVDMSGVAKPNKVGPDWRVGIGMTKTWSMDVIVDPLSNKITELNTEDD